MKILVANLGSTSFKYRLFDLAQGERQLAKGGIDRIGQPQSQCTVEIGGYKGNETRPVPDHAAAVALCLEQLSDTMNGCVKSVAEVEGIGFKAVFAGKLSGVRRVDAELLAAMEELADVAPAHNPPYVRAMRQLMQAFPQIPLVAALETAFHETIPVENRAYAVPYEWYEQLHIRRWGFHGASHRFLGQRVAELTGRSDLRLITCHLGGSNSMCAQRGGVSQATTMGMTPQTGLPQNNRVGDFDAFALPVLMRATGKSMVELLAELSGQSGLLGLSGLSNDVRDLEDAASKGHERADLALKVLTQSIKHYLGAYMAILGGVDVIAFSGGIGENSARVRRDSLVGLEWANVLLDETKNASTRTEAKISADGSGVAVWVVPTNEELTVARQTRDLLQRP